MEYPLFSDRQQEPYLGEDTSKYRTVALTAEVKLPLAELWLACTEYIHLWWPLRVFFGKNCIRKLQIAFFVPQKLPRPPQMDILGARQP